MRSTGELLGAEKVILDLARASQQYGYDVTVGVIQHVGDPEPELLVRAAGLSLRTARFEARSRIDLRACRELGDYIHENNIDIVHTHGYKEDIYVRLSGTRTGKIATNHLWKKTTPQLLAYMLLDALVLRSFDMIVAVSRPIVREMRLLGISRRKLYYIPNGIDIDEQEESIPAEAVKRRYRLPEDHTLIAMVSSLTPEKDHVTAIQAFARLAPTCPETTLVIVGDGPERNRLEQLAGQPGLKERIIFTGRQDRVQEILSAIDIFLMTSRSEGLPIALLEAMAAGKPAVVTAVGDIPHVITDGVSGLLTKKRDATGIAATLRWVIDNPEKAGEIARQAHLTVREHYSAQAMARQYCDLYNRLL